VELHEPNDSKVVAWVVGNCTPLPTVACPEKLRLYDCR
jgi:hypothetical protein